VDGNGEYLILKEGEVSGPFHNIAKLLSRQMNWTATRKGKENKATTLNKSSTNIADLQTLGT
jgi:hypothetical protein